MGGLPGAPATLAPVTVLLVLTAGLAGCTGQDEGTPKASLAAPSAPPAEAGRDTGAIDGLVTDDQFNPIVGVQVGILQLQLLALSDEAGRFTFSRLQPGSYDLATSSLGHEERAQKVPVRAGEVSKVHLVLTPIPTSEAYEIVQTQRGLFGCGASWRPPLGVPGVLTVSGIAACGVLAGQPVVGAYDKFLIVWDVDNSTDQGWTASAFEMQWATNQAVGKGLTMIWEVRGCSNSAPFRFARTEGRNPLAANATQEQIQGIIANGTARATSCEVAASRCTSSKCSIQSRVFSSPDTLGREAAADLGLTFQQPFEQYHTIFYNGPVPPGYSALAT